MATPDNVVITSNKGKARIVLGTAKVTGNITKKLKSITKPKTPSQQSAGGGGNSTLIIDILRELEERITVQGFICDDYTRAGVGSLNMTGATITDVETIKNTLLQIFKDGGTFNLLWAGTTYRGNSDKIEWDWVADDSDTIIGIDIQFTMVIGTGYGE